MWGQNDPLWQEGMPIHLLAKNIERVGIDHNWQIGRIFTKVSQQTEQVSLRAFRLAQTRTHQDSIFSPCRE
jgi:hypothetical protein